MASLHSPTPLHFPHSTKIPHHTTTTTTTSAAATRRSTLLLLTTALFTTKPAIALDFRMTVPDQTVEEAEAGIQSHAQSLLNVKDLLTSESWKEAQKQVRKSSSLLKQDIYTIIQAKPPDQRPRLRMLYAHLFTAVTKLDYAVRDKDRIRVWECYHTIVFALHHILSTLPR
ncbi:hypothetical protein BUALT_Bualt07G0076900 [Buddleja alternifolia]|uniref:PsbQ-like protein 3, chloroplastic n=1 Tax=Buddleja alternifolia TaxID=168488 RepID=A0AAV6XFW2_9LAMI|nr:hypothetical protein BUALT_Bualt07G0076900 [Buddleja alternifolia]